MWTRFLNVALWVLSDSTMSSCSSAHGSDSDTSSSSTTPCFGSDTESDSAMSPLKPRGSRMPHTSPYIVQSGFGQPFPPQSGHTSLLGASPSLRPSRVLDIARPASGSGPVAPLQALRPALVPILSDSDDDCVEVAASSCSRAGPSSRPPSVKRPRGTPLGQQSTSPVVVPRAPHITATPPCPICPVREQLLRALIAMSDPAHLCDCCHSLVLAPAPAALARAIAPARPHCSAPPASWSPRHHAPHPAPVVSSAPLASLTLQPGSSHASSAPVSASSGKRPAPSTPLQPRCKWAKTETVLTLPLWQAPRSLRSLS